MPEKLIHSQMFPQITIVEKTKSSNYSIWIQCQPQIIRQSSSSFRKNVLIDRSIDLGWSRVRVDQRSLGSCQCRHQSWSLPILKFWNYDGLWPSHRCDLKASPGGCRTHLTPVSPRTDVIVYVNCCIVSENVLCASLREIQMCRA